MIIREECLEQPDFEINADYTDEIAGLETFLTSNETTCVCIVTFKNGMQITGEYISPAYEAIEEGLAHSLAQKAALEKVAVMGYDTNLFIRFHEYQKEANL